MSADVEGGVRPPVRPWWDEDGELEALRLERERLRDGCQCDPPGSGEELCTGHCVLRAELDSLKDAYAIMRNVADGRRVELECLRAEFTAVRQDNAQLRAHGIKDQALIDLYEGEIALLQHQLAAAEDA